MSIITIILFKKNNRTLVKCNILLAFDPRSVQGKIPLYTVNKYTQVSGGTEFLVKRFNEMLHQLFLGIKGLPYQIIKEENCL